MASFIFDFQKAILEFQKSTCLCGRLRVFSNDAFGKVFKPIASHMGLSKNRRASAAVWHFSTLHDLGRFLYRRTLDMKPSLWVALGCSGWPWVSLGVVGLLCGRLSAPLWAVLGALGASGLLWGRGWLARACLPSASLPGGSGWPAGWLAGWLSGWLAGWLAGWLPAS